MCSWYCCIIVIRIVTAIMINLMFLIRPISVYKLSYFSLLSVSFCVTFLSTGFDTSVGTHVVSFLFLIGISGLFAITPLTVCTPWFH